MPSSFGAAARLAAGVAVASSAAGAEGWPREPPSWPHYPGREVFVLNGTWDFAFLGNVPLRPRVPAPAQSAWQRVTVPDAFDLRADAPRCGLCWPTAAGDGDRERCERCCSRAFGQSGDAACWERPSLDDAGVDGSNVRSFSRCCGQDALRHRRGVGVYRALVETAPRAAAVLLFGACTLRCLVAVDGVFLADHSGLSPFSVDVPASEQSVRTIVVLADNRFNEKTHPVHQPKFDWYQAGGLLRAVQFHVLPAPLFAAPAPSSASASGAAAASALAESPVYLASVEVLPMSLREVDVVVRPSTAAAARQDLGYRWRFDDVEEGSCAGALIPADGAAEDTWRELRDLEEGLRGVEVPGARPWSPERPSMHRLKVALLERWPGPTARLLDCVEVRFGLRRIEARGRELLLNGEPLRLFGVNRHDMTETPVLSRGELERDLLVLAALGANFVRGAHYAQDQRFLDLCDERGILVWEEALGWQPTPRDFADGIFMSQSLRLADEMATASANHPSVIFFGFFNEGRSADSSPATAAAYAAMAARLRERSRSTRLISWGSNALDEDRQLEHADVCAFHGYPGWYPTGVPVDMEEVQNIPLGWESYARWVEDHHPNKPLLITEAGAGGLFGHKGASDVKWTEEYQSLLVQMHILSALRNPRIAGLALWQFADVPVDQAVVSEEHRPRGLNNKGLVGLNRQPKVAFQAARLLRQQKGDGYFGLILPEEDAGRLAGKLRI